MKLTLAQVAALLASENRKVEKALARTAELITFNKAQCIRIRRDAPRSWRLS